VTSPPPTGRIAGLPPDRSTCTTKASGQPLRHLTLSGVERRPDPRRVGGHLARGGSALKRRQAVCAASCRREPVEWSVFQAVEELRPESPLDHPHPACRWCRDDALQLLALWCRRRLLRLTGATDVEKGFRVRGRFRTFRRADRGLGIHHACRGRVPSGGTGWFRSTFSRVRPKSQRGCQPDQRARRSQGGAWARRYG
jgi:hypothetical protein